MTTSLPIRNAIIKAKLTPASIKEEMNSGLTDKTGEIYDDIRNRYISAIEAIPTKDFKNEKDLEFRDTFIKDLKKYNFTSAKNREEFCFLIYNVDLAGSGMKVL